MIHRLSSYVFAARRARLFSDRAKESPLAHLRSRQLLANATAGAEHVLAQPGGAIYCGFDPTADDLHVGSLLTMSALAHLQRSTGKQLICLVGGATGQIGDPTGRSTERQPLTEETLNSNLAGISATLQRILVDRLGVPGDSLIIVDNREWYDRMSAIEFMKAAGCHMRVNAMLARDSVKQRLAARPNESVSLAELTYQAFQYGCTVQLGGSDQWGNITAGTSLIRRHTVGDHPDSDSDDHQTSPASSSSFSAVCAGITVPLAVTSAGEKIGKSAGNAIWLNPEKTSPYDLYQYFMGTADADCTSLLLRFTALPAAQVAALCSVVGERAAQQHNVAHALTRLVHGEDAADAAQRKAHRMFYVKRPLDGPVQADETCVTVGVRESEVLGEGGEEMVRVRVPLRRLLREAQLVGSSREATRTVEEQRVQVGRTDDSDAVAVWQHTHLETTVGATVRLRLGKRRSALVHFQKQTSSPE